MAPRTAKEEREFAALVRQLERIPVGSTEKVRPLLWVRRRVVDGSYIGPGDAITTTKLDHFDIWLEQPPGIPPRPPERQGGASDVEDARRWLLVD